MKVAAILLLLALVVAFDMAILIGANMHSYEREADDKEQVEFLKNYMEAKKKKQDKSHDR